MRIQVSADDLRQIAQAGYEGVTLPNRAVSSRPRASARSRCSDSTVSYLASDLVARSFPVNDDRAGLDVGAHWTSEGVKFAFRSAVLSTVKPG